MRVTVGYVAACNEAFRLGGERGVHEFMDDPMSLAQKMAGPYGRVVSAYNKGLIVFELDMPDDPRGMLLP